MRGQSLAPQVQFKYAAQQQHIHLVASLAHDAFLNLPRFESLHLEVQPTVYVCCFKVACYMKSRVVVGYRQHLGNVACLPHWVCHIINCCMRYV